jgi:hypothetical protein
LEIVELHSLHNFPEVVLAHHTDCGKLAENDREDHIRQMKAFAERLHSRLPNVVVQITLVHTHEAYVEAVETMYSENAYIEEELPE